MRRWCFPTTGLSGGDYRAGMADHADPPGALPTDTCDPTQRRHGVWCVVVAAGAASRFGSAKQFAMLTGRPVYEHAVDTALASCEGVVLVVPAESLDVVSRARPDAVVVAGGDSRSASVRCGLAALPEEAKVILVHDAARPLATPDLFERVVAAVRGGSPAVAPAVPLADTIRHVDGGVISRDTLRAVQTPQGFDPSVIRHAHSRCAEATDDATLVESMGVAVTLVPGEADNLKLTTPADLRLAEALIAVDQP